MTVGASTSNAAPETVSKRNDPTHQPWIEKYRPQTLDDVAANKDIVGTIKRLTDENRLPHLLLYGPPGVFYPCCAKAADSPSEFAFLYSPFWHVILIRTHV